MFNSFGKLRLLKPSILRTFTTSCDAAAEEDAYDEENSSSLIEEADAMIDAGKSKLRAPRQFTETGFAFGKANVNTYDGFRFVVQKQVNLNTVVSHFYWLGSQMTGQPIYQYRLILPFDEKVISVATDMDLNIESDVKYPLNENLTLKSNIAITDQKKMIAGEMEYCDKNSASNLTVTHEGDYTLNLSRMQSITPALSLGAAAEYKPKGHSLSTAFLGLYDHEENVLQAQWDTSLKLLYLRRVNPNRVTLMTGLTVAEDGNTESSIAVEYELKQSKITMGLDSNLTVKSSIETSIAPGVQLQICAEVAHLQAGYRFGYGIVMG